MQDFGAEFERDCKEWLSTQIDSLTHKLDIVSPSKWAEDNRYLPASVSPLPGFYNYSVCPYLKEIVDCMDVRSTVREVTVMKGAQIGATVGVLENTIGYFISQIKSAPMMLLTADGELAKIRMDGHVTVMIQQSGLSKLIKSSDELSRNKTGKTNSKIEWIGGGYILPFGARNAAKLRSNPIQVLLEDEIDGYPEVVGKDGDPMKLAEGRTKAYSQTRKILRLSTPLVKGVSRIERAYQEGDQRRYHVPCKKCKKFQELKFYGMDEKTGAVWGLTWDRDDYGMVATESVRYVCKFCGHRHINSDKMWMLPRGKWIATARPIAPFIRSYHISAMYSPAAMYSWGDIVRDYLNAWDVDAARPKDIGLMQEFYNNVLGKTFELRGKKVKFATVSGHRRAIYRFGEIPNIYAQEHSESRVQVLTCAVDVHKDNLAVAVFGWTQGCRSYLIDYWRFWGDPEQENDPGTWGELSQLLETKEYIADDGCRYRISLTLIDSGYMAAQVYGFCEMYDGVYPIKGRDVPTKNAAMREFSQFYTPNGKTGQIITVDFYKDRMSAVISRIWAGTGVQSPRCFNAPADITDAQLKELTAEQKREKINRITKKREGFEWHRPSGSRNELWDLLIYNAAAIDIVAWDVCNHTDYLGLDHVNWAQFWDFLENEKLFYDSL